MPRWWARCLVLIAGTVGPTRAEAHEGWGIVRDRLGRVYVADIAANTVWMLSGNGRLDPVLRDVHTHALVVHGDGRVYGTDVSNTARSLWRLEGAGRTSVVVPPSAGFPLDLQSLAVDASGRVYSGTPYQPYADRGRRTLYLLRWSRAGAVDTLAGGLLGHSDGVGRAARFQELLGMAWLSDGSLAVVDGPYVRRVDADGGVTTLAGPLTRPRFGQALMGLTASGDGSVLVADFAGRRVQRLRGGAAEVVVPRTGWFWAPTGALQTERGIYVLEHPRAPLGILGDLRVGPYLRLRVVEAEGASRVLARRWGDRSTAAAMAAASATFGIAALGILRRRRRRRSGSRQGGGRLSSRRTLPVETPLGRAAGS